MVNCATRAKSLTFGTYEIETLYVRPSLGDDEAGYNPATIAVLIGRGEGGREMGEGTCVASSH